VVVVIVEGHGVVVGVVAVRQGQGVVVIVGIVVVVIVMMIGTIVVITNGTLKPAAATAFSCARASNTSMRASPCSLKPRMSPQRFDVGSGFVASGSPQRGQFAACFHLGQLFKVVSKEPGPAEGPKGPSELPSVHADVESHQPQLRSSMHDEQLGLSPHGIAVQLS